MILWDVDSRKPLTTLHGHKGWINSVAFSPDGKRLASTSSEKAAILWDLESLEPLATLEEDKGRIFGAAFNPTGKQLALASENHAIALWDLDASLDLDFLRAEACHRANRNLTCEEWQSYIGADKPYRKSCEALPGPRGCT